MNELSKFLAPWLAEHGFAPHGGMCEYDYILTREKETTLGWICKDYIEVGTKISLISGISSWYGSPYTKLYASDPNFLSKLLVALEFAAKVGHDFDCTHKQVDGLFVPLMHPEPCSSLDEVGLTRS